MQPTDSDLFTITLTRAELREVIHQLYDTATLHATLAKESTNPAQAKTHLQLMRHAQSVFRMFADKSRK
jgi:hypothetical protein